MRSVAMATLVVSMAVVLGAGVAARWRHYGESFGGSRILVRLTGAGLLGIAASVIWLALAER